MDEQCIGLQAENESQRASSLPQLAQSDMSEEYAKRSKSDPRTATTSEYKETSTEAYGTDEAVRSNLPLQATKQLKSKPKLYKCVRETKKRQQRRLLLILQTSPKHLPRQYCEVQNMVSLDARL